MFPSRIPEIGSISNAALCSFNLFREMNTITVFIDVGRDSVGNPQPRPVPVDYDCKFVEETNIPDKNILYFL